MRTLLSNSAMHKTAEAAELAEPPGLLALMDPVVTAPSEQMSAVVTTLNAVVAATVPALRFTPLRTKELAPAGRLPAVTVTVIKSYLPPITGVWVTMFEATSVAHGDAVVVVNIPEGVEAVQDKTEEKAVKKPTGKAMYTIPLVDTPLVVVKDTVARAPLVPG